MATYTFSKNGGESRPVPGPEDIKIVVVGEPKCGKTTFIKTIYELNKINGIHAADYCTVYPIKYEISKRTHHVNIFDFDGFREQDPSEALRKHKDTHGFIFMYAIDDPLSFERVADKWYAKIDALLKNDQQAILVGNKRDLRDDPLVIQRLAGNNQVPVTKEQGENLAREKAKIGKYFDCSSAQNLNVTEAFEQILAWALTDLTNNPGIWL